MTVTGEASVRVTGRNCVMLGRKEGQRGLLSGCSPVNGGLLVKGNI